MFGQELEVPTFYAPDPIQFKIRVLQLLGKQVLPEFMGLNPAWLSNADLQLHLDCANVLPPCLVLALCLCG
jgi:hypothetical protein